MCVFLSFPIWHVFFFRPGRSSRLFAAQVKSQLMDAELNLEYRRIHINKYMGG